MINNYFVDGPELMMTTTPYAGLSPDTILNAIESIGYFCSGSLLALNSYENRVYQVGIEEEVPLIAKFYRPARWSDGAILEEHAFSQDLAALEIPVIAPLVSESKTLHTYSQFRFALFPRRGGHALELENIEQLEWMGRFIGRLHAVGASKPYRHRPRLDVDSHGHRPFLLLKNSDFIPDYLKQRYCTIVADLLEKITVLFAQNGPIQYLRIHGDCHAGNVLWNSEGPHIVDLDDSVMGPAIQDIWMLLSGTPEQMRFQLDRILSGYVEFHDFNPREIKLIEGLRALRMIQYAAWIANRWEDPAFPAAFPWFNTAYYWQQHVQNLQEQADLLACSSSIDY